MIISRNPQIEGYVICFLPSVKMCSYWPIFDSSYFKNRMVDFFGVIE